MNAIYEFRRTMMLRYCAWLALSAAIVFSAKTVQAQVGLPLSDFLEVTVTDQNGVNLVPALIFPIAEPPVAPDPGEPPVTITVPGIDVNFVEQVGAAQLISDRFHLEPFTVTILSRDGPGRTNARLIPPAALETFFPLQIIAFSDGETSTSNISDAVRIRHGFWNALSGPGDLVFSGVIEEPIGETIPEPRIVFETPPARFDVAEPPFEDPTGQIISDYVDIQSVHGFFLSSGNTADYAGLGPADATLVEDFLTGGLLHYNVRFVSHVIIPEPASVALFGIAIAAFGMAARRTRSRV